MNIAMASATAVAACCGATLALSDRSPAGASPPPAVADCSTRSMASFPGGFSSSRNLVVGPLALMGGATYTPPNVVREFGGNKFPLLVKAGHVVTIRVAPRSRRVATLGYGPLPEGEVRVRDGHREVRFVACRQGKRSGSDADGHPVTFWSGFVLTRSPACVSLDVFVDDARSPRRVGIPLGRRCQPPR